ncbi:DUF6712 family protein [Roseivirga seohaensis]|uniref:DUF6712 family protein n=1 Tax=Roseivirga seohaensis TaxID=1914963 RepID=UPI003BA8F98E
MLFNLTNNGASELQSLTGSYYQSNDFDRTEPFVILAEEWMIDLTGQALYDRLLEFYTAEPAETPTEEDKLNAKLLQAYRMPIAYKATFDFYQTNLVSHEDTGRKVKLDKNNESMAWEWMLDRDDLAQLQLIGKTTDRLFKFLDKQKVNEWLASENRMAARKLFVNSVELFNNIYPIDKSHLFYQTILPFISEVQRTKIKPALGAYYADQLEAYQRTNSEAEEVEGSGSEGGGLASELDQTMIEKIQQCVPLLAMIIAVQRLSLQALPYGVVQQFKSDRESRSASTPTLEAVKNAWISNIEPSAKEYLEQLRDYVKSLDSEVITRDYIPENSPKNKFFST